jgi:hypothetical protein
MVWGYGFVVMVLERMRMLMLMLRDTRRRGAEVPGYDDGVLANDAKAMANKAIDQGMQCQWGYNGRGYSLEV